MGMPTSVLTEVTTATTDTTTGTRSTSTDTSTQTHTPRFADSSQKPMLTSSHKLLDLSLKLNNLATSTQRQRQRPPATMTQNSESISPFMTTLWSLDRPTQPNTAQLLTSSSQPPT